MGRLSATMGVLVWALAVSPAAQADGGRITFTGAVVEPTCSPAIDLTAMTPSLRVASSRCPSISAATRYSLSMEPAIDALPGSRVIAYHDQYLRSAGASSLLVTQVYD